MTVKRSPKISDYEGEDADTFVMSMFLTELISVIQPTVDKGTTFELLYAMLGEEVSEEVAAYYGDLIRKTSFKAPVGGGEAH